MQACRERFAEPLRLTARPSPVIAGAGFLIVFGGFSMWLALEVPAAITYVLAAVSVLVFGGITARVAATWSRERVLVLGPDALTLGSRTVPWTTVRTVRRTVTNGKTDGVEIIQEDGARTLLHLDYGRPLDELASLIDPALVAGATD